MAKHPCYVCKSENCDECVWKESFEKDVVCENKDCKYRKDGFCVVNRDLCKAREG